ncbi:hypothetical protein Leryth_021252 [Lithospermum erythrorhizon]|nr:hypothetical protein Leryth_021252 [Lithospermum erythrorhizon]
MSKVDEFGRLVREDHSDNDSGDSPRFTRRRSKRGRSRSWSQSPIRGRSRSRSRSPRGRRRRSPWRDEGGMAALAPHTFSFSVLGCIVGLTLYQSPCCPVDLS